MRPHSVFSLMPMLLLAILLGLGPVIAGRAQEATPEATSHGARLVGLRGCGKLGVRNLPVPLNYSDPTSATTDLALTRLPAADPARRSAPCSSIAAVQAARR